MCNDPITRVVYLGLVLTVSLKLYLPRYIYERLKLLSRAKSDKKTVNQ